MQTSPAEVTMTGTLIEWAIVPLTPVICTENAPDELPETVSIAVPEPVMVAGLMMTVIPDEALTVSDTTPENALREFTVMVEVPEEPEPNVILDGLADKEKSGVPVLETVTVTVVECDSDPLVPVTCTVNVPVEFAPTVSVAVPEPVMLVGLIIAPMPGDGVTVKETNPLNPLNAVTVMVEVPEEPWTIARLDGFALMEKSGVPVPNTVTIVDRELMSFPL
jgi:hypothetical protein